MSLSHGSAVRRFLDWADWSWQCSIELTLVNVGLLRGAQGGSYIRPSGWDLRSYNGAGDTTACSYLAGLGELETLGEAENVDVPADATGEALLASSIGPRAIRNSLQSLTVGESLKYWAWSSTWQKSASVAAGAQGDMGSLKGQRAPLMEAFGWLRGR